MTAPGEDFRAPSSFGCSRGFWVTHGGRRVTISIDDEALGAGTGRAADEALQQADGGGVRVLGPAVRAFSRRASSGLAGRARGRALPVGPCGAGWGCGFDAEPGVERAVVS